MKLKLLEHQVGAGTLDRKPTRFSDPRRGSRHERGYGNAWDRTVRRIRARDCDMCQPCERRGDLSLYAAIDHKVPKAQGGTDDDDNLQVICRECHTAKTSAERLGGTWDGSRPTPRDR